MPGSRILILGGTAEGRAAAEALTKVGYDTITSLAGVTTSPSRPAGEVRSGGFGGAAGLAAFLKREHIALLVDATHPFALQISRHAARAAQDVNVPLIRFERAAWEAQNGDTWIAVAGIAQAVAALPENARAFVTVGRKEIGRFFARADLKGVARMIEAPEMDVPEGWTLILERPPFNEDTERELMCKHRITHVVSKNAGGGATLPKIAAARLLCVPVVMVARPVKPVATRVTSSAELLHCIAAAISP